MNDRVCPYCHTDRDGYVQRLPRTGEGYAYIYQHHPINGGWTLHMNSKYRTFVDVQIKFCPMCGRELKEGE